jgi:MurNAc alpha-1-phosphate uridylyltransferase
MGRMLPAMILAAGRGERMKPLTDTTPKPLLAVRGRPLIEWHLQALARDGVSRVVINTAWLGMHLPQALGDGRRFGLRVDYSHEGETYGHALETAGGIREALPLLCPSTSHPERFDPAACFWLMAGDVFMPGFVFDAAKADAFAASGRLAHLWLVPNPPQHPKGDFGIGATGLAVPQASEQFTYSTVALMRAELVAGVPAGTKAALAPLLRAAMGQGLVSAELWPGEWYDVGTPERLQALNDSRGS